MATAVEPLAPPRPSSTRDGRAGEQSFRPDVEGLRAVAVALVVLYHAGVARLTGGYVGVDVFFVISGFLITGRCCANTRAPAGSPSASSTPGGSGASFPWPRSCW